MRLAERYANLIVSLRWLVLPLINNPQLVPAAREQDTTVVTYLFTDPTLGLGGQDRVARG